MMESNQLIVIAAVCALSILAIKAAPTQMSNSDIMSHLQQYGYLEPGDFQMSDDKVKQALSSYQRKMMGASGDKGEMDFATAKMMQTPRCGISDFKVGQKWPKKLVTYRISKYTEKPLTRSQVDSTVSRALKMWSDVADISFAQKSSGPVDIEISFENRKHGDKVNFDGPGKVLAHAFYPTVGNIHFDEAEDWTLNSKRGINLLAVTTHELGHSLGIEHSMEFRKAVMFPMIAPYDRNFALHADDIEAVQYNYGKKSGAQFTQDSHEQNMCNSMSVDAVFTVPSGNGYIFKGTQYWKVRNNIRVEKGYPKQINSYWKELPRKIDAAFTNTNNNKTYFFRGNQFWRYTYQELDSGYPKLIKDGFPGAPIEPDLVFRTKGETGIYFFKGSRYWLYTHNRAMSSVYPKLIVEDWAGLPNNLDAAVSRYTVSGNMQTMFFKGNQYYSYDINSKRVLSGFPRDLGKDFFGCT